MEEKISPPKYSSTQINIELTQKLKSDPKYDEFLEWGKVNGVVMSSIDYPVAFGNEGLVGGAAKCDIGPNKGFLFVPSKILITLETARDSEIGIIIKENSAIFKEFHDGEYLTLAFFLMYELLKGKNSFWYPYFQIITMSDMICFWEKEDLIELQDLVLIGESIQYKEELIKEWKIFSKTIAKYSNNIDIEKYNYELFLKAYTIVISRCFGWFLPSTMMIPFADSLNHSSKNTQYQMYNSNLQYSLDKSKLSYYIPSKMKTDFSAISQKYNANISKYLERTIVLKGYHKTFAFNESFTRLDSSEFDIWDYAFYSSSQSEDNDSSSEEESEYDESKEKNSDDKLSDLQKKDNLKEINPPESSSNQVDNLNKKELIKIKYGEGKEIIFDKNSNKTINTAEPSKKEENSSLQITIPKEATDNEEINLIHEKNEGNKEAILLKANKECGEISNQLQENEPIPLEIKKIFQNLEILKPQNQENHRKDGTNEEKDNSKAKKSRTGVVEVIISNFEKYKLVNEEEDNLSSEEDEESFDWYDKTDKENYFCLCTQKDCSYKVGEQVFVCYGRRNNAFLLLNYGFCFQENKYNSVHLRVWADKAILQKLLLIKPIKAESLLLRQQENFEEEIKRFCYEKSKKTLKSKCISLKKNKLCNDLLNYVRSIISLSKKPSELFELKEECPSDLNIEYETLGAAIEILTSFYAMRFSCSQTEDRKLLNNNNISLRKRFAILYRYCAKEILIKNINLLEILQRIISDCISGTNLRLAYRKICQGLEDPSHVISNRRILRNYLRLISTNIKSTDENNYQNMK